MFVLLDEQIWWLLKKGHWTWTCGRCACQFWGFHEAYFHCTDFHGDDANKELEALIQAVK